MGGAVVAYEIEAILRFPDGAPVPTQEEIEESLECVVVEWIEEEV